MSDPTPIRTEIASLGEFGLIDYLAKKNRTIHSSTLKSIGDDAAVIDPQGKKMLVSTDLLIEGIHFDLMYTPLKHLGHKSIVANVSDIIAMNAIPSQVTVSIALSNKVSLEALTELYEGIYAACDAYQVDLVGGDTTSSQKGLLISVTAIGWADEDDICYRNTAKVGDLICVTGDLGAAFLGLQILEREKQLFLSDSKIQPDLEDQQYLIGRQLKPEARLDIIQSLKRAKIKPSSMIDISDGLASELLHICTQSNVGALIVESQVPLHPDTQLMALKFKLDPITTALSGGEDYELLFTINPDDHQLIQHIADIYVIGEIKPASEGIQLQTTGGNFHPIKAQGWNHFNNI